MKKAHGVTTYANGSCRCRRCRSAWATYMRERRAVRRPAKPATYYADQETPVRVRLTPLGSRLLETVAARTGHTQDDVVESLLRGCGQRVQFDDPKKTATA